MTPDEIEKMKADMEAGTPGPWNIKDCDSLGDRCTHYFQEVWNDETDILVTTEVTRAHNDGGRVNIRRIARTPQLEAEVLRLRRVMFEAQELGEAGMLDEMLATIDGAFLDGGPNGAA